MIWKSVAAVSLAIVAAPALAVEAVPVALTELLADEQRLAAAAEALPPAEGIGAMLAEDVRLYARGGPLKGRADALAALKANPANHGTGIGWRKIKSGISGDGTHGFTFGYASIAGGDVQTANRRYLAYWIKTDKGWRIAALKQALRPPGEPELASLPTSIPAKAGAATDAAAARASLIAAKKAFSDRAQVVGLGKAFEENGRSDAINSAPDGVKVGPAAIGAAVSGGESGPSPVEWSADEAIVAPSGDLGITFGTIRPKQAPPPGQPAAIPFFTIWMRDGPDQPWRYVAE
jgi:ketosteroid isomerase-like protein